MSKWHWIIIILLCAAIIALGVWLATRPPYALGCVPSPTEALAREAKAAEKAGATGGLPDEEDK